MSLFPARPVAIEYGIMQPDALGAAAGHAGEYASVPTCVI
jgi:hypothetical protein